MRKWLKKIISFFRSVRQSNACQAAIKVVSKTHPEVGIANDVLDKIAEKKEKDDGDQTR